MLRLVGMMVSMLVVLSMSGCSETCYRRQFDGLCIEDEPNPSAVCQEVGGICALDAAPLLPCPHGTSNLAWLSGWSDPADCGAGYTCCLPDGGYCAYRDIEGTCTVTTIEPPGLGSYDCANEPVIVGFSFAPLAPPSPGYLYARRADVGALTVAEGANPPSSCVTALGITEGSQYSCKRREEIAGSCTPVLFEIPSLDFSGCQCF